MLGPLLLGASKAKYISLASTLTGLVYREYTEDAQMKKDGFID